MLKFLHLKIHKFIKGNPHNTIYIKSEITWVELRQLDEVLGIKYHTGVKSLSIRGGRGVKFSILPESGEIYEQQGTV